MIKKIIKIKTFIAKQIVDINTYGTKELFRKLNLLIKILLKIPMDIIAIVPCIIIRLISPLIIIRIGRVHTSNYGDFAGIPATYYCKKKLKINFPTRRYIDLLYMKHQEDKIFNKQLAKMWKRKLNFLSSYILNPIDRVSKFIPGWKIHKIEILSSRFEHDSNYFIENCQPLSFTPQEEIYGKKILKKFGLKDSDKFVCLAVRDGAHQLTKISPRYIDWSYHDYRSHNINNFVLAAEELTKRGYYIFRMGTVVEKPFKSNNPKIIDYPYSDLRSDFMDVYLGAKCSFCISTGLGFDEVPYIFRRPIALIVCPIGDLTPYRAFNEKFLFFPKHLIFKKEKKKLSFSEVFSHGVAYAFDTKIFQEKGIEVVDCASEEIKDLAIEMVENFEFNKKLSPENEKLQETFRSLFASNIKRFKFYKEIENPPNKMHGQIRARLSTKFIRNNPHWLG